MTCRVVIPVDPSQTVEEAWKEDCIFGRRVTVTGPCKWAIIECDGQGCSRPCGLGDQDA